VFAVLSGGGGQYEKYREAWWRLGADSAER